MLSSLGWSKQFSIPKAAGMQLLLRIRNSPGALSLSGDARTSDDHSPRQAGLSIDELGDLSIDRNQREQDESRRFEHLPEGKTQIGYHKMGNVVKS